MASARETPTDDRIVGQHRYLTREGQFGKLHVAAERLGEKDDRDVGVSFTGRRLTQPEALWLASALLRGVAHLRELPDPDDVADLIPPRHMTKDQIIALRESEQNGWAQSANLARLFEQAIRLLRQQGYEEDARIFEAVLEGYRTQRLKHGRGASW